MVTTSIPLTEAEALEFLRAHQPMPADADLDDELIDTYDSARRLFRDHPNDECIPLFLNSFGDGDGLGVYQLVDEVIHAHDPSVVVRALADSLASPHPSVRSWSAELAAEVPDPSLSAPLQKLLSDPSPDTRTFAVYALAEIGGTENAAAIETLAATEREPEVIEAIELARENLSG